MLKPADLNHHAEKALRAAARAAHMIKSSESIHEAAMKRHALRAASLGLGSALLLTLATICTVRARDSYRAHRQWQALDAQLDDALAESLDASDSVAKY